MITTDYILRYLNNDCWFRPNKSKEKFRIKDERGNNLDVAKSYYHTFNNGMIIIRVSEHGTYIKTWVKSNYDPSASLQNLSIVFSNGPITYKTEIEPEFAIVNGVTKLEYKFFVIEQYEYRLDNLNEKDFKKVISQLKTLDHNVIFQDPLKKKPSKKANRRILTPTDKDGNKIPPSNVHPRQKIVADNPDKNVDANGNLIDERKHQMVCNESELRAFVRKIVEHKFHKVLDEKLRHII